MAKKAQTQTGTRAMRAIFEDARRAVAEAAAEPHVDPHLAVDGVKPGEWEGFPSDCLPPGCPVQIVGRDPAVDKIYAITASGHFRVIEKYDLPTYLNLWAPRADRLKWAFPGWGKKKLQDPDTKEIVEKPFINRIERDKVTECLIMEAARRGDFDPNTQHRGRGGWQDSHGAFVWHSGGWLWKADGKRLQASRPVMYDGFLYTRQAATIEPWQERVSIEESPAQRILAELRRWAWQRPYIDPILVLGWIATALMGGALKARPILFTTGGAGVGKSTLQEFIRNVLDGAVIATVNTTAAGIYQRAKQDSLPFLVDELENKPGSTRAENVIELARVAYTGGDISRGGQDHEATTFTARNSFCFSAINPPAMGPQDKSRMAMLNLSRLDGREGVRHTIDVKPETDGRMLLRQIMDGWSDFSGRLMQNYFEALRPHGLDSRAIDTFGTLLAAAELLVGPDALEDAGLPVTDETRLGEMVAAATRVERAETMDNWHGCLDHLFQSTIDSWREGVKPTVGYCCEQLREGHWYAAGASERLSLVNLGAKDAGKNVHMPTLGPCLAVPADGPVLKRIFADTVWQQGGWYQALKSGPKDIVIGNLGNGQKVKINGSTKNCLLVDLAAFDAWASKVE